jgi:hypothetical protein
MGCDIHIVVEQRVGDKWVGLHAFPYARTRKETPDSLPWGSYVARGRNYEMFGKLANVRGNDGIDPKGLPDDASDLTMLVLGDEEDLHSHTWWSMKDAWPIFLWHQMPEQLEEQFKFEKAMDLFGISIHTETDEERDAALEDYRLCIAFDN